MFCTTLVGMKVYAIVNGALVCRNCVRCSSVDISEAFPASTASILPFTKPSRAEVRLSSGGVFWRSGCTVTVRRELISVQFCIIVNDEIKCHLLFFYSKRQQVLQYQEERQEGHATKECPLAPKILKRFVQSQSKCYLPRQPNIPPRLGIHHCHSLKYKLDRIHRSTCCKSPSICYRFHSLISIQRMYTTSYCFSRIVWKK